MSNSLWPHGLQHTRLPRTSPPFRVCSDSCLLSWWTIQPSHSLSPPSPALNLSQHQGLFQWVGSSHQVAKVLGLQHQSFQWKSGLIYFSYVKITISPSFKGFPGGSDGKASARNAWDLGSIPGSGRSPGEGNGNPFQYSWLGNPMDRGAWQALSMRL